MIGEAPRSLPLSVLLELLALFVLGESFPLSDDELELLFFSLLPFVSEALPLCDGEVGDLRALFADDDEVSCGEDEAGLFDVDFTLSW